MHEAVSDILIARSQETDGISRMVMVSLAAHAALIAIILLMPASWRSPAPEPDATPMMITLGGAPGPDAGGRTPIAGRAVQAVAPPEAMPKVQPPPAAKAPEMVLPDSKARVVPKAPPRKIDKPSEKSTSPKVTTGAVVKPGSAVVDTGGAAIPFGGLSTGGGSPVDGGAFTDYADFCCPGYLNQMTDLIKRNWDQNQGATGQVQVRFTIRRDGTIVDTSVEKPSGAALLDLESRRAVEKTARLPPLPREFTQPTLTVHLIFQYSR